MTESPSLLIYGSLTAVLAILLLKQMARIKESGVLRTLFSFVLLFTWLTGSAVMDPLLNLNAAQYLQLAPAFQAKGGSAQSVVALLSGSIALFWMIQLTMFLYITASPPSKRSSNAITLYLLISISVVISIVLRWPK